MTAARMTRISRKDTAEEDAGIADDREQPPLIHLPLSTILHPLLDRGTLRPCPTAGLSPELSHRRSQVALAACLWPPSSTVCLDDFEYWIGLRSRGRLC